MWRVGILLKSGKIISKNFSSKEKCEDYIISMAEKLEADIKKTIIINKNNTRQRYSETWN